MIRLQAKREKTTRKTTITINVATGNDEPSSQEIIDIIDKEWIEKQKQPATFFWQSKDALYCQFITIQDKTFFLDVAATNDKLKRIFKRVQKPNDDGEHFTRKPMRISIDHVRNNIKTDKIKESLLRCIDQEDIEDFRESKPNQTNQQRSILFRINAGGYKRLFEVLDGTIPYYNGNTNTKLRLNLKVNCRPWQCKNCYLFGQHQCEGKLCNQCGNSNHATKDCKAKTRFCSNCKKSGHRAKDANCPRYMYELSKELRKIDIPIEHMESEELRFALLKNIQIR